MDEKRACTTHTILKLRSSAIWSSGVKCCTIPEDPEHVADGALEEGIEALGLAVFPHLGLRLALSPWLLLRLEDVVLDERADRSKTIRNECLNRIENDECLRNQGWVDKTKDELDQVDEAVHQHGRTCHCGAQVDPDLGLSDLGENKDDDPFETLAQVE